MPRRQLLIFTISLLLLTGYFSVNAHPLAQESSASADTNSCYKRTDNLTPFNAPPFGERYAELYLKASDYYASGNYLLAFFYANLATKADLHPADAYNLKGRILLTSIEDYELALPSFTRAIEVALEEYRYIHIFIRGVVYQAFEDYERAIIDYNDAISLEPRFAYAYFLRGWAQELLGNFELAFSDFEQAVTLDPNCKVEYVERGFYYYDASNLEVALLYFNRAVEMDPTNIDSWVWRGITLDAVGDSESALKDLHYALTLDEEYANAYWGLGNALFSLQHYPQALENYLRYQELSGDYESAFVLDRIQQINDALGNSE